MRKLVRLGGLTVALLAVVACDPASDRTMNPPAPEGRVAFIGDAVAPPPSPPPPPLSSERRIAHDASLASAPAPDPGPDRKIVRNASLRVEVKDARGAAAEAMKLAEAASGLVASSSLNENGRGGSSADVQLRVPAAAVESILGKLEALGNPTYEATAARDVTREYVDVEARLRVKSETESRLRDLLRTTGAKLSDVVEVERELDRVVTEIERMEAERRFLASQVDLATIDATFYEPASFRADGFVAKLRGAWSAAGEVLGASLASMIHIVLSILPWLVMAAGLFWFVRHLRRRHL